MMNKMLIYMHRIHQISELTQLIKKTPHLTTLTDYDNLLKERDEYYEILFEMEIDRCS